MSFELNRWKKAVTLLIILGLFLGMNTLLLPWTASAATGSITVKVDGEECKIFTPEELEELQEEEYYTYSTINTWPTKSWYIGEGPTLVDILEKVEMPEGLELEDIQQIRIKAKDGLQLIFTKKELLDDTRYYFPGLRENHEYFGYISGSTEETPLKVPVALALLSIDSDDPADLEGRDKNAPHLLFGQRWITEQTNQAFVKTVSEIDLLTDAPKKWDNPTATPEPGIVSAGTKVRLSCEFNDADKVYYTVDGSDPTYKSPMYNWVAARWWNNRKDELDEINKPIEINENTTIKAVTIGNGKADSDIVIFKYLVSGGTWYVDGSGSADFTTIQEAVTAASAGDTIIVRDGTYTENVIVDRSLIIQSENGAESTIVQAAAANADVFKVTAENVTIDGFTVSGATTRGKAGILIMGSSSGSCRVKNNKCSENDRGISLEVTENNTISNNICTLSGNYGIHLANTTENSIIANTYTNNTAGSGFAIYLADNANNNIVSDNISDSNTQGIRIKNAYTNTIFNNTISNNDIGLELATRSEGNLFYLNNFVDNTTMLSEGFQALAGNFWNSPTKMEYMFNGTQHSGFLGNYWDDYTGVDADGNGIGDMPYQTIQTDSDNYPLMGQWDDGTIIATETAQLQLSIDFGIPGVTVFITGDGFNPDTDGVIWFDTNDNGILDDGEPSTNLTTDTDGAIPLLTSLVVPSADLGNYNLWADIDGIKIAAGFTVTDHGIITESISGNYHVSPNINITGSGFPPDTNFRLFCDRNGNWIFDDGAYRSGKTDADGTLSAKNLSWPSAPTGIYNFLLDLNSDDTIEAAASICVVPGIKITNPRGNPETNIGMNIAGFEGDAEGYIWFDVNGNGIWDEGENKAPVTTSSAGTATTPGLFVPSAAPGDYQVCADLPARGLKTSSTYSITGMVLEPSSGTAGTEITVKGYGYVVNQESSPTTGKYIWFDTNGNGVWDDDEIKVDVTTDANGTLSPVSFIVPEVPAGSYNVCANIFPSGTLAAFTVEEAPVTKPSYKVEPVEDDVYTISETEDSIKIMTVNDNQIGFKNFTVAIESIEPHEGAETVIFIHIRDGVQLQLNALEADFDKVSTAKAGFNIRPDDVIKVYIVDKLTNDSERNPVILQ